MDDSSNLRVLDILLVEDNPADVRIAGEALKLAGFGHRLHVVMDGEQAVDFLLGRGEWAGAPWPDVVLLDIQLPKLNGFEVLKAVRSGGGKRVTVVVLTGSDLRTDAARARELLADLFISKPVGVNAYVALMKRVRDLALTG